MRGFAGACSLLSVVTLLLALHGVNAGNPYRYYTWRITYGDIYPLGVKQQVQFRSIPVRVCVCISWVARLNFEECVLQGILINGQFPGPTIDCVTNDNLIINVYNYLNEPFLLSW